MAAVPPFTAWTLPVPDSCLISTTCHVLGYLPPDAFEQHQQALAAWADRPAAPAQRSRNVETDVAAWDDGSAAALGLANLDEVPVKSLRPPKRPTPPLCRTCFRLVRYGEIGPLNDTFHEAMQDVRRRLSPKDILPVLVADMSDFPAALAPALVEATGGTAALVLTKADLLTGKVQCHNAAAYMLAVQSSWQHGTLLGKARRAAANAGLKAPHIYLTSSLKDFRVGPTFRKLAELAQERGQALVFIGCSNAGKSALINAVLSGPQRATVSPTPGTTQALQEYELILDQRVPRLRTVSRVAHAELAVEHLAGTKRPIPVFDTPGYLNNAQLFNRLPSRDAALLQQRQYARPFVTMLKPGQAVLFGGLGWLEVLTDSCRVRVSTAVSGGIQTHVTRSERYEEFEHHVEHFTSSREQPCLELAVAGLGFLVLTPERWGAGASIRLTLPPGIHVCQRESLDPDLRRMSQTRGKR
ncbi:uncharacterized protein MONBRDRAFT_25054 [Monosiga brevicollis MX1]|uniref:G domain-containing protein n=1 Tax=Monosiga brevicollis TaxID=81824 RepID=A9UXM7_MONBE|nr:uncharacterized protein MONBRDRAFT_25054 [Monosiga brevicollis MX1]EDQ90036.1 predicted protein [Monosiga brevicollis MX1]|eukprot:XP_001745458.1 hypothetical protein [Monosiga brevicollis MX1]